MADLYMTPRTYFDSHCHEYQTYPIEQKLLDIGYATWHGHDIMDDIRYILDNYPYVSESCIQLSLWTMMAAVNHVDPARYICHNRNNPIETDAGILVEDLMRVFRLPHGDRRKAYLGDSHRQISFRELDEMNGWKEALEEERQPYRMFSDGNWIMFPGDGDLVRKFNLENATQECGYLSYVYPEPWYGGPTRAKVIILGNEARYDDFVSRIQNNFLRRYPAVAEDIQCLVDGWINLERYDLYQISSGRTEIDGYASMDLYNSITYRYWLTEIRRLASILDIEIDQELYTKVAVINANPYPSIGAAPLAAGLLPSHYFLRQLVRFIVSNNPHVKFVLPSESLRHVWRTILADVYTDLIAFDRLIVLNKSKSISLTHNLTQAQATELRRLLKTW